MMNPQDRTQLVTALKTLREQTLLVECEDCEQPRRLADLCKLCKACISSCCAVGGELCKCGGHLEGDELELGVCCDCYPASPSSQEAEEDEPTAKRQRYREDSDEEEDSD